MVDPPQLLSVVAPVFDEEENIKEFRAAVDGALAGHTYELILVDDGSRDRTPVLLDELAASDERVKLISLSRNFGHQAALTAGLDHASGDVIVMMDSDLQDPPRVIPEMLERWRDGAEVVTAIRRSRTGESRLKLATARWFYKLFGRLAQIELQPEAGDFRLFDRAALDAMKTMRERNRFIRGMSSWVGFRQESVTYERDPRHAGKTKFTLSRMLRFAVDGISAFSYRPLQAATVLGFTFSLVAFIAIPVAIGFRIAGEFVPGVTTVLMVVLLLGGIQLITVGIIGEYLGRVYEEVKQRPLYLVRSRTNVTGEAPGPGTSDASAES